MAGHRWRRFLPRHGSRKMTVPRSVEALNEQIEQLKASLPEMDAVSKEAALQKLLILQTPRAALAQNQMDRHKHGYRNREKRLFELIDFNDTLVSAVLALDHSELTGFTVRIKQRMADFCKQLSTPMFTDEQFEAIVHGLSVEIAVYRAARADGLEAGMTSRTQDAFGIDMVIRDPETKRQINIDCKTPSAFHYRLKDLLRQKHITTDDFVLAEQQDYLTVMYHHEDEPAVPVTIVCIRPERVGDITDFSFADPALIGAFLRPILAVDGHVV